MAGTCEQLEIISRSQRVALYRSSMRELKEFLDSCMCRVKTAYFLCGSYSTFSHTKFSDVDVIALGDEKQERLVSRHRLPSGLRASVQMLPISGFLEQDVSFSDLLRLSSARPVGGSPGGQEKGHELLCQILDQYSVDYLSHLHRKDMDCRKYTTDAKDPRFHHLKRGCGGLIDLQIWLFWLRLAVRRRQINISDMSCEFANYRRKKNYFAKLRYYIHETLNAPTDSTIPLDDSGIDYDRQSLGSVPSNPTFNTTAVLTARNEVVYRSLISMQLLYK